MAGSGEDRREILPGSAPGRRSVATLGLVFLAVLAAIVMMGRVSRRDARHPLAAPSASAEPTPEPVATPPPDEPVAAAAPAAAVNPAPADDSGATTRNQAAITRVIADGRPALKACYERALVRDDSLVRGRMKVHVSIAPSGRVDTVTVAGPAAFRPLRRCLETAISRWAFPGAAAAYVAEFPLMLEASR